MNNPKRNHHTTPKFYLKGFVIKKGEPFIWVYKRGEPYNPGNDKVKNNPYTESIKSAGVERDFYADPKEDGTQDFETFENKLELIEESALPIIHKLRARQAITNEEKSAFSGYIIHMYRRVQSGREMVRKLLARHSYEPSPEVFEVLNWPDTPERRLRLKKMGETIAKQNGFDQQAHNRISIAAPDSFNSEVLEKMTWNFFTPPTPHAFLASDNPVFISEKYGLKRNFSELSFPIATDVCLVASWNKHLKEGFSEVQPQILKELNRRTIAGASQYVYFSQSPAWVVSILDKDFYEYHPMYSVKAAYDVVKLVKEGTEAIPQLIWS